MLVRPVRTRAGQTQLTWQGQRIGMSLLQSLRGTGNGKGERKEGEGERNGERKEGKGERKDESERELEGEHLRGRTSPALSSCHQRSLTLQR